MRGNVARPIDAAEAAQRLAKDFRFVLELSVVGNVLVVAAAAHAEMRAGRDGAIRGWLDEPLQARANEFLLLLDRLGGDALGRQHERDEDRGAVVVGEAFPAVNQLFNSDVHGVDAGPTGVACLVQIKQAEARHAEVLEKPLLHVLPLELRELPGGHLSPVGRERAVDFAANGEQRFLFCIRRERGGQFFFEHGQAALEIFKVDCAGCRWPREFREHPEEPRAAAAFPSTRFAASSKRAARLA